MTEAQATRVRVKLFKLANQLQSIGSLLDGKVKVKAKKKAKKKKAVVKVN